MMEDSSRFLTLSGLSGIFAGLYALAGAAIAYFFILEKGAIKFDYSINYIFNGTNNDKLIFLVLDAIIVIIFAVVTAWLVSYNKAKREQKQFWSKSASKMLINLFIPLSAGGALILAMIFTGSTHLVASSMLIFYGIALINASKYTIGEIKYLGITELIIGIFSLAFLGYGFYFWVFGFGLMHILYGFLMWKKYK